MSRHRIEALQADIEAGVAELVAGEGGSTGWRWPPASPAIRLA
jgi:hypothetical protein